MCDCVFASCEWREEKGTKQKARERAKGKLQKLRVQYCRHTITLLKRRRRRQKMWEKTSVLHWLKAAPWRMQNMQRIPWNCSCVLGDSLESQRWSNFFKLSIAVCTKIFEMFMKSLLDIRYLRLTFFLKFKKKSLSKREQSALINNSTT